ncbi:hypothetical protein TIFTF001_045084 [Ficus carica]|uniref:Retrotransposon gag domain-containing protein n=1 Tax=Ficus carica TaxID=3494 RepID=A0AA87Z6Q0_FICCA|nr:hypothetical protein TIFTF001_045084 [Ficus carica]
MAARHVVLAKRKLTTYVYAIDSFIGIRVMDEDRDAAMAFFELRPLVFDGTRRTVSLAGWLFDMEMIFRICHIEAHLQVLVASRCLQGDVRLWWMAQGDPAIHGIPWADFRAHMIARYGPLPGEGANAPYRDPDTAICIGDDISTSPRSGTLTRMSTWATIAVEVKYFVPAPEVGVSLEDMIDAIMKAEIIAYMVQEANPVDVYHVDPVDDAGIPEPVLEEVPIMPEDPIPAVPLQQIPPQEVEAGPNNDMDPSEVPDNPRDNAEDLPIIHIESDDEEQEVWEEWEEFEDMEEEELEDLEEQEEDPEEIPFDDEDWDVFSDVTIE